MSYKKSWLTKAKRLHENKSTVRSIRIAHKKILHPLYVLKSCTIYELCLALLKEQFYTVDFKWLIKTRSARLLGIKNTLFMLKTMFLP